MKKILVVEDNVEVKENIAELLELSGYDIVTAENGKIGAQLAIEHIPDLILCDVMMPVLDGYGMLHILSHNPKTADIPFIFLTAKTEREDFRKGMLLGADDYIMKPFSDVELLDAIEVRLKKRERLIKAFDGTLEGLRTFVNEAKGLSELKDISEQSEHKTYFKKERIYEVGQYPRKIFYILHGRVKAFLTNDEGKDYITDIYKKGDFFGYLGLLKGEKYDETTIALEETEIAFVSQEDFFHLLYKNQDFASQFIKILSNNVVDKENQLLKLAYNSIRKRVADALVYVCSQNEKKEFSILRDDLANLVGTAKESVIRTLSDFKSENIISIEKGIIKVLDSDKLKNMPN